MKVSVEGSHRVDDSRLEKAGDEHNSVVDSDTPEDVLALAYTSGKHPDLAHPLNLPRWRKWAALLSLSWSALLASYGAAASLTAFPQIAKALHVTVPDIAHSVGYSLLGLAIGPLFWSAVSMSAGRKPALVLSSVLFIPCVAWLASATSYKSYSVAQFFSGAASSATQTVPPMVIADMFKKTERGDKLSTWAVAVLIGPGVSPLISAFIISKMEWRWIYYVLIILIGVQLITLLLFLPETQYMVDEHQVTSGRIGVRYWPWNKPGQFMLLVVRPLLLIYLVPLTATAVYYGMVFGFSVGLTVVAPRVLAEFYAFDTQAQGLSYLAFIIGGILGKTAGGWFGDRVVLWKQSRTGERHPEYRLWAMLPLLPLLSGGLLIFGLCLQFKVHWSALLIGAGIHYAALCGSSGLLQTYMLESYLVEPVNAMVMSQFWRCMWGFAVPFFAFEWGSETSWQNEYITQAFLVLGLGLALCGSFIVYGQRLRRAQGMPSTDNM